MKQEEKTKNTYNKILNAAIVEFGSNSYENASINTICNTNGISKGLIYHNFKNKDELYLRCVEVCFHDLLQYLQSTQSSSDDGMEIIQKLMNLRQNFFLENPLYSNLFFQTILQPPKHLVNQLKEIRIEFDNFHAKRYRKLLDQIHLRDDISMDMAMEYFFLFQEMFNEYYHRKADENKDLSSLIKNHESGISNVLNIILYGIAKEK